MRILAVAAPTATAFGGAQIAPAAAHVEGAHKAFIDGTVYLLDHDTFSRDESAHHASDYALDVWPGGSASFARGAASTTRCAVS
jgi:hypothetical protein